VTPKGQGGDLNMLRSQYLDDMTKWSASASISHYSKRLWCRRND